MPERRFVTSLDVGTAKVCAIIAEQRPDGQLDVLGVGTVPSHGLRKGMVVDLDRTIAAVTDAVMRAERMAGVSVVSAYLGVAGGHVSSLNSQATVAVARPDLEITRDDVDRVLTAARTVEIPPDREVLHVLPREFSVDGCRGVRDPVGMSGVRLGVDVHIVTAAVTAVQNMIKCVERAGVAVEDVILQPLASAEAVLTPDEREGTTILIDIGGGTTDVAVFHAGGIWHTAVIAVGGHHVTNDLAVGLRVSVAEAEAAKLAYGHYPVLPGIETVQERAIGLVRTAPRAVAAPTPEEIIAARVEEIFSLVARELEKIDNPFFAPGGVVITGGAAQLSGLAETAERILRLPVRIGRPLPLGGSGNLVTAPAYATGVGLALLGSRQARPNAGRPVAERRRRAVPAGHDLVNELVARIRAWFSGFIAD